MNQELVQAVKSGRILLFVGAGLSNQLGLPSFRGLIRHLASDLGFDPDIYQSHGDYLALAEYYLLEKRTIGPLRSTLDREWHSRVDISDSEAHRLIVELDFPLIYTTNYDSWIERAFEHYGKPYVKIANVGDIAKASDGVTEIIKFHGDFEDDKSIVLSETSYFERLDFESPLDVKLRADLLGRSVLFVGYSLADVNIRLMLYRLHRQWRTSGYSDQMPKSFIYLARPNPVQERILLNRGVHPIVTESDDPSQGLTLFLQWLCRESRGRA